jgi:hypothetical protein
MNNLVIKKIDYDELTDEIKYHIEVKRNLITFSKRTIYFGAFINSRLIGCVGYNEYKEVIRFKSSFVLPEYRRLGIFSLLSEQRRSNINNKNKIVIANVTKYSVNYHLKRGATILKKYKAGSFKIIYSIIQKDKI